MAKYRIRVFAIGQDIYYYTNEYVVDGLSIRFTSEPDGAKLLLIGSFMVEEIQ